MVSSETVWAVLAVVAAVVVAAAVRAKDQASSVASTRNTTPTVPNPMDPTPNDPNEPDVDLRNASAADIASTVENTPDISGYQKGLRKLREQLKQLPRTDVKEEMQIVRNKDDLQEVESRLSFIGVDPSSISREAKLSFVPVPNRPTADPEGNLLEGERRALERFRSRAPASARESFIERLQSSDDRIDMTQEFISEHGISKRGSGVNATVLLEGLRDTGAI